MQLVTMTGLWSICAGTPRIGGDETIVEAKYSNARLQLTAALAKSGNRANVRGISKLSAWNHRRCIQENGLPSAPSRRGR